ncbi:zinc metalloproteinase nas-13-like [Saccoglossus kowalevskii]|uniref:Metalloendopeptidase n=1 Tax=Saccoglossus kowalevskii TaxID=10224 RepID=A0ABM0GRU3_SACKO|nr:PREDICTED: zinc metalloproteinase nas-13-like [Saccoglossus kowalevskii]
MLFRYIALCCLFLTEFSHGHPVERYTRDVDKRALSDDEPEDGEPLITTWPDLPTGVITPQFDAQTTYGQNEEDAMSYILTENRLLINDPDSGFLEGDIYIGPDLPRNAITNMNQRWSGGIVPYEIDYGFDSGARSRIMDAISQYTQYTCIKWTPRTNQRDYVRIVPKSGCWSAVGRTGGMQELSVGGSCTWSRGTIMHEMMHAAGFHHEQTRTDRDSYVTIYWANIQRGMEYNFEKYNLDSLGTEYDYASIMHYPRNAFSVNGQDTIVPRQSVQIGNRNSFSQLDIYELNKLYECDGSDGGGGGGEVGGDCNDKDNGCSGWAQQGYCRGTYGEWMSENCKDSCGICDDKDCVDNDNRCDGWARRGECTANPEYMLTNCQKSCKECSGGGGGSICTDANVNCEWWANQGYCTGTHSAYMKKNCKKSCGQQCNGNSPNSEGTACYDYDFNCGYWQSIGECARNPAYMLQNCQASCGVC